MVNVVALQYNYQIVNRTTGQTIGVIPGGSLNIPIKVGDVFAVVLSAWPPATSVQLQQQLAGTWSTLSTVTTDASGYYLGPDTTVVGIQVASLPTRAVGGSITSGTINMTGTVTVVKATIASNTFPTSSLTTIVKNWTVVVSNTGTIAGIAWLKLMNKTGNPGLVNVTISSGSPVSISVGSQVKFSIASLAVGAQFSFGGTIIFTVAGEHYMGLSVGHTDASSNDVQDDYLEIG